MSQPAAKQGDQITATDMHLIQPPPPSSPQLMPHPFKGIINGGLSSNVRIMGMPAATVGSTADNMPPHFPNGGSFVNLPTNKGTIMMGSKSVRINQQQAARNGDTAMTCNDVADFRGGTVMAAGTVFIGG